MRSIKSRMLFLYFCALACALTVLAPVPARADAVTETTTFGTAVTGLHDALLGYVGTAMPLILSLSALLIGIGMMFLWFKKKSKSS